MVTVGMYYEVLPGRGDDFVTRFREVMGVLREATGHTQSHLYRDVDDPDSYAILSEWESREEFQAFIQSDLFRQVAKWGRDSVLKGPPRHKIYPRGEDLGGPPRQA